MQSKHSVGSLPISLRVDADYFFDFYVTLCGCAANVRSDNVPIIPKRKLPEAARDPYMGSRAAFLASMYPCIEAVTQHTIKLERGGKRLHGRHV